MSNAIQCDFGDVFSSRFFSASPELLFAGFMKVGLFAFSPCDDACCCGEIQPAPFGLKRSFRRAEAGHFIFLPISTLAERQNQRPSSVPVLAQDLDDLIQATAFERLLRERVKGGGLSYQIHLGGEIFEEQLKHLIAELLAEGVPAFKLVLE